MPKKSSRKRHKSRTTFKPITLDFDITSVENVVKFSHELIVYSLKGKLDPRRHGAINGTINNVIRIHQPPLGTEVNVTQVAMDPEQIITGFLNSLSPTVRNAVNADIKQRIRALEASPSQI